MFTFISSLVTYLFSFDNLKSQDAFKIFFVVAGNSRY